MFENDFFPWVIYRPTRTKETNFLYFQLNDNYFELQDLTRARSYNVYIYITQYIIEQIVSHYESLLGTKRRVVRFLNYHISWTTVPEFIPKISRI